MSSVGSLWDKGMEPIIRMLKTAGGCIEVPGVARLEYEWNDDGTPRKWIKETGRYEPHDDGDYVIYLFSSLVYGGEYTAVYADPSLFRAIMRFAYEVDNFDPSWNDDIDSYLDARECLEDHRNE